MKKAAAILSIILIVFSLVPQTKVQAMSFTPHFEVNSESAVLYNMDLDTVVYSKNADLQQSPVQLVHIMTAIICLENITDLEGTVVTVPSSVNAEFGEYRKQYPDNYITTADFQSGEELTMKDLMYGMMLASSCEAASTIAYHVGDSSIKNFVNMMNAKAAEIGASSTVFVNANGLYADGQYTTANDMLKITKYAFSVPGFENIATTQSYTVPKTNKHGKPATLTHSNVMMSKTNDNYYAWASGIKTGNSVQSGRTLITKGTKDGSNYLLVLMNSPIKKDDKNWFSHLEDAKELFEWAFSNIELTEILSSNEDLTNVKVLYGADGKNKVNLCPSQSIKTLWLKTVDISTIKKNYTLDEDVKAPITKGQKLGTITLMLNSEEIGRADLIASYDVKRSELDYNVALIKQFGKSKYMKNSIIFGIIGTVLYIALCIYIIAQRRKQKKTASQSPVGIAKHTPSGGVRRPVRPDAPTSARRPGTNVRPMNTSDRNMHRPSSQNPNRPHNPNNNAPANRQARPQSQRPTQRPSDNNRNNLQ